MKIRHLLEDHSDSELFWESMQDHGWKPVGEFLVSPDDDSGIAVGRNMHLYYRGVDTRIEYTDANYADLLRFEDDEDVQKKLYSLSNVLLNFASEAVQLAAVRQDGWVIKYIEDQSEAVKLAAVQQNGYAIQHIENPSEAVQLAAVRRNGNAIQFIRNPSEAVQLAAVQNSGEAIYYINNPSEAVQLAAVQQDGHAIRYIENPSKAVQDAVANNPYTEYYEDEDDL